MPTHPFASFFLFLLLFTKVEKVDPIEVTLADFDGVLYHVSNPNEDRNKVQISINAKFFRELKAVGVEKVRNGTFLVSLVMRQSPKTVLSLNDPLFVIPSSGDTRHVS